MEEWAASGRASGGVGGLAVDEREWEDSGRSGGWANGRQWVGEEQTVDKWAVLVCK